MEVYIVLFRQSGEEYNAEAFNNKESAHEYAREFLESFVSNKEDFHYLDDLEFYCADNDLAYIDIVSKNIQKL